MPISIFEYTCFKWELNFWTYLHKSLVLKGTIFGGCQKECKTNAVSLTALLKHIALSTKKSKIYKLKRKLKFFHDTNSKIYTADITAHEQAIHVIHAILICYAYCGEH